MSDYGDASRDVYMRKTHSECGGGTLQARLSKKEKVSRTSAFIPVSWLGVM